MKFTEVIQALEAKGIMPKTKPGLEKIRGAITQKDWFKKLDPKKIITVAGTNGKGTTSACIETLLMAAKLQVGLYTSPHLIQTTERIRVQGKDITEQMFCELYQENLSLIESCELSHFESLTLMAADYFFSSYFGQNLDYVIFEVGLGGSFDATNIFPNHFSVITALGLDHVDILGHTLTDIAHNKFGIVKNDSVVVYQKIANELYELKQQIQAKTSSRWVQVPDVVARVSKDLLPEQLQMSGAAQWVQSPWGIYPLNLMGERAVVNSMTALTLFEQLGFSPVESMASLARVRWSGRMQKVYLKKYELEVFLSGDHNPQGIDSLLQIVREISAQTTHFILGIGKDKKIDQMLEQIFAVPGAKIYLTETPFKGTAINDYPAEFMARAEYSNADIENVFAYLSEKKIPTTDCIVVTGSLYLVGQVLRDHQLKT